MNHRGNISQLVSLVALPAIASDTWACPVWHLPLASRYRLMSWMEAPKPEPDIRKTSLFGQAPGHNFAVKTCTSLLRRLKLMKTLLAFIFFILHCLWETQKEGLNQNRLKMAWGTAV